MSELQGDPPSRTGETGTSELIRVHDRYYILASSSLADHRTHVLKHGDTFAVFDRWGDVRSVGTVDQGVFHDGTRHLSRAELRIEGRRPLLLSSTTTTDDLLLAVDLTNPDLHDASGRLVLPRGTLHLFRSRFLAEASLHERIVVRNHGIAAVHVALTIAFDADFCDIFEVRGAGRDARGTVRAPEAGEGVLVLSYDGLDGVRRVTRIAATATGAVDGTTFTIPVALDGRGTATVTVATTFHSGADHGGAGASSVAGVARPAGRSDYETAWRQRTADHATIAEGWCAVETSNERFNDWLERSYADLRMMTTQTEHGPYPYAGVPWFNAPFGRDALITAHEVLWVAPAVAAGVLRFLAATQATEVDAVHEAQPGKILHEMRRGEMAALGEVPFGRYYGTADATPLFVGLAADHLRATDDPALLEDLWPNVEAALEWIDGYGDADGDGFVEYAPHDDRGLVQQGWKDSHDSVFHADGSAARPPIALCEVQAYTYAAKRGAAGLAARLRLDDRAASLREEAARMRERFEEAFWCDDLGTYAIALDGDKRPCRVRTSNAGHVLFAGLADPSRARRVAETLLSDDGFSGWGIRTVAAREARYNPISYHNGSVWPHDNAIVAEGLARYGRKADVLRVLEAMFAASQAVELHRLPELWCGFARRPGQGLVDYPGACAPQAWAAGAVFSLLRACLGLTVDAPARQVRFVYPVLPPFLDEVRITGLRVGASASLDLVLRRHPEDVGIAIVRREGDVEVVTVK